MTSSDRNLQESQNLQDCMHGFQVESKCFRCLFASSLIYSYTLTGKRKQKQKPEETKIILMSGYAQIFIDVISDRFPPIESNNSYLKRNIHDVEWMEDGKSLQIQPKVDPIQAENKKCAGTQGMVSIAFK